MLRHSRNAGEPSQLGRIGLPPKDSPSPSPSANPVGVTRKHALDHISARSGSSGPAVSLKRLLLGNPIPSHLAHHERLSRVTGLAVLSSDALSSVAYATEDILATLVVAGAGASWHAARSASSSRRSWQSSPSPTGRRSTRTRAAAAPTSSRARTSARPPGLIAAAALLIDYIADRRRQHRGRRAAITSAFPDAARSRVELCLAFCADPDRRQPARHPRVGPHLRGARPTSSSSASWRCSSSGAMAYADRRHRAARRRRARPTPDQQRAHDVPAPDARSPTAARP